jgi:hypothetical protein
MLKNILCAAVIVLSLASCSKEAVMERVGANTPTDQFIEYIIAKGTQNANLNQYKPVNTTEMKFTVKFDNSAIYQTVSSSNQADINKLYGFSDNNQDHHMFSARFGWRWYSNTLQLFAYVYNNGVMSYQHLGNVAIGAENKCSIKTAGNQYIFTLNGTQITMPRAATTEMAIGYQLYPFFGGTEMAPQEIKILIKNS